MRVLCGPAPEGGGGEGGRRMHQAQAAVEAAAAAAAPATASPPRSPSPPLGVSFPQARPRRPVDGGRGWRTEDKEPGLGLIFRKKEKENVWEGRPPEEWEGSEGSLEKGGSWRYGLVMFKEINF